MPLASPLLLLWTSARQSIQPCFGTQKPAKHTDTSHDIRRERRIDPENTKSNHSPGRGISVIPVSTYLTPPAPGYHRSCSVNKSPPLISCSTHVVSIFLDMFHGMICRPSEHCEDQSSQRVRFDRHRNGSEECCDLTMSATSEREVDPAYRVVGVSLWSMSCMCCPSSCERLCWSSDKSRGNSCGRQGLSSKHSGR